MSDPGVYEDEMLNNRFSDQDVERMFSGQMPEDDDLARLAPILETLHDATVSRANSSPSERSVTQLAVQAAEIATSAKPRHPAPTVPERTPTRPRRLVMALRTKLATGLTALLLLSGMTGVAIASDEAAPGDPLYGLDRALEAIGINDGGAAERITEAQALFNEGDVAEAVAHVAEAVESTEVADDTEVEANTEAVTAQGASEALLTTAERLRTNESGSDHAITVRNNVATLLEYMATTEDTGSDFGHGVAERARQISPAPEELPDQANDAADQGADNGSDAADNADNADDAADASEDAGPPEGVPPSDPPEDAGAPDDPSSDRP